MKERLYNMETNDHQLETVIAHLKLLHCVLTPARTKPFISPRSQDSPSTYTNGMKRGGRSIFSDHTTSRWRKKAVLSYLSKYRVGGTMKEYVDIWRLTSSTFLQGTLTILITGCAICVEHILMYFSSKPETQTFPGALIAPAIFVAFLVFCKIYEKGILTAICSILGVKYEGRNSLYRVVQGLLFLVYAVVVNWPANYMISGDQKQRAATVAEANEAWLWSGTSKQILRFWLNWATKFYGTFIMVNFFWFYMDVLICASRTIRFASSKPVESGMTCDEARNPILLPEDIANENITQIQKNDDLATVRNRQHPHH